jgi:hypothetical protein
MFISDKHYHSVNQEIEDMKAELDTMFLPGPLPGRFLPGGITGRMLPILRRELWVDVRQCDD